MTNPHPRPSPPSPLPKRALGQHTLAWPVRHVLVPRAKIKDAIDFVRYFEEVLVGTQRIGTDRKALGCAVLSIVGHSSELDVFRPAAEPGPAPCFADPLKDSAGTFYKGGFGCGFPTKFAPKNWAPKECTTEAADGVPGDCAKKFAAAHGTTYGTTFGLCSCGHVYGFSTIKKAEGLKDMHAFLRRFVLSAVRFVVSHYFVCTFIARAAAASCPDDQLTDHSTPLNTTALARDEQTNHSPFTMTSRACSSALFSHAIRGCFVM